jgi:PAS domain S-box-containing protein
MAFGQWSGEKMHASRKQKRMTTNTESDAPTTLALYASIVESSEDAIIGQDLDGTILSWNGGATAVYGYTAAEMVGRSIAALIPQERSEEEQGIRARIRAGQRVHHFETVRLKKDGLPIDVSLTISPVREEDRIVGASHIARDISDRKRLESGNAQLAAVVESSEDAIISKDLNGRILTWNAGAEHIYGYTATEAVGLNMTILLPPGQEEEEQQILERIRRGERVGNVETSRVRKGGTPIAVALTISPIRDPSGKVIGASHIAHDITERKEFEQQMRQAQRLESLGVLAGGIAHDFNNLLTGILGNASLVAEEFPLVHPLHGPIQDVITAAERAADLTRQLLAYSGKGRFVMGPLRISEAVEEISALLNASIPKWVAVRLELEHDLPMVEGDRSQIQQLAMNLILNGAESIEENRPGLVTVRAGSNIFDEAYLRAAFPGKALPPGEYVYLEVQDNGCGMDDKTRARIFDPFFSTKFMGRGLGLAAALGIVESHHGGIRVQSAPGQGSTFQVLFPVSEDRLQREPKQPRGTVLVIDDEEIIRRMAKIALEQHGYRVLVAGNGKEGVDLFGDTAASTSLIILDWTMPVMSGEDALRRLRAIRPDVSILLTSGYSEEEAMRRFGDNHLAGFLQKPYSSAQLRRHVDRVLGQDQEG